MIPFPKKKYNIIYADPPWYFKSYSKKGEERNATKHYPCMEFNDLCNLNIDSIAAVDCVLFMWVVDPLLHKSFELLKAWNFKFKTVAFSWVKQNRKSEGNFTGMGYWTRANPEMCLLATRGKPKRVSMSVKQLVMDVRREHSRKPDRIRNDIVELCGDLPRIELFARQDFKSDGWDNWGNEL